MTRDQLIALEKSQKFIKDALNLGWFISKLYQDTEGVMLELTSENKKLFVQFCFDELNDEGDVLLWINRNNPDGTYTPQGKSFTSQMKFVENGIIIK